MWWRGAERSCPEQPHPPAALVSHGGLGCHRAVSSLLKWHADVCWRLYAIIRGHRCTLLCVVLPCHRSLFFVFQHVLFIGVLCLFLCTRAFPCFYVCAFYWCVVPFAFRKMSFCLLCLPLILMCCASLCVYCYAHDLHTRNIQCACMQVVSFIVVASLRCERHEQFAMSVMNSSLCMS